MLLLFLFLRLLSGIETDFGLEAEPALSAGKGFAASLPAAGGFDTTERGVEGTGGGRLYMFGRGDWAVRYKYPRFTLNRCPQLPRCFPDDWCDFVWFVVTGLTVRVTEL